MEQAMAGREPAVRVRGAYKRYSPSSVILRGLNMTVLEGTIYGLLGPSGCGKTTLLKCVLGRTCLDAGEIYVKAKRLSNVGYMPQELALYKDMTMAETFNFYGRIFGMHWEEIEDRSLDLLKFLDLPDSNKLIGNLSGGQMRRVSLAIALLHDPQLLILDEPTAGVDPVLSFSIWERLLKMAVSQRKTIIITTHYIEEAKQAHTIGLMRHGILLAEEAPQQLVCRHQCSSLEQAFLLLSQAQHDQLSNHSVDSEEDFDFPTPNPAPTRPLRPCSAWDSQRFLAQLVKNFVWNLRNLPMLAFVILLPAMQSLLCNMILGSEPHNMYLGIFSEELPRGLADCVGLPPYNCSHEGPPLSCSYAHFLRTKQLHLKEFTDEESGRQAVIKGESWGFLMFPENYTRSFLDRLELGQDTPDQTVESSLLTVWMDMSNLWVSSMIKRDLVLGMVDYIRSVLTVCDDPPQLADLPLKFEEPIFGLRLPKFIHFCTPGLVITFCFYLPIMFTTGAIMMEKEAGLLERSLTAGMTVLEVVAAHTVIQIALIAAQNAVIFLFFYVIYFNPLWGSLFLLLSLVWLIEFMGIAYAFLLAVAFESEKLATYAGVGTIVGMFIICGIVWPYQGMHWAIRGIVSVSPIQPAVEAYRAIAEKNWGLSNPVVAYGFCNTIAWLAFFSAVAYTVAVRKKFTT